MTKTALCLAFLLALAGAPPLAQGACDPSPPMGDWRQGTETSEEAQDKLNDELAESLANYLECLREIMPDAEEAPGGKGSAGEGTAGEGAAGGSAADGGGAGQADAGEASQGAPSPAGATQRGAPPTASKTGQPPDGSQEQEQAPRQGGQQRAAKGPGYSSRSSPSRQAGELDKEGSYARALREAYHAESDPALKAAFAAEYEKLTGRPIPEPIPDKGD